MKRFSYWITVLSFLFCSMSLHAASYTASMPAYAANPGSTLSVPLELDNAAGLARIRVQINYNEQILTLVEVTPGSLGTAFDMSYLAQDGSLVIDFIRSTSLNSGSGRLADLSFTVNEGATTVNYSDLAIADFDIGDASGVRDISINSSLTIQSGSVQVSNAANIDNFGNGLPDWWEADHGLQLDRPVATNTDSDGDGIVDLLEFALMGNPTVPDAAEIAPVQSLKDNGAQSFITLSFRRRTDATAPAYLLMESDDLGNWWNLDMNASMVHSVDLGDGTEAVEVQGSINLKNPSTPKGFLKLEIQ